MKKIIIAVGLVVALASNSFAGYVSGTINNIIVTYENNVFIQMSKIGGGLTGIYQVGATGDALKTLLATALTAKASNLPVEIYFTSTKKWTKIKFK